MTSISVMTGLHPRPTWDDTERSVLTRALGPMSDGCAVDPRAEESSIVALHLIAADPLAIPSGVELRAAVRQLASLLDVLSLPGRTFAFVELAVGVHEPDATPQLVIHVALGTCGPTGTTRAEACDLAGAARRALEGHPAPYRAEVVDPSPLFEVEVSDTSLISQRSVTVGDASGEASVVSRFDKPATDWLTLVDLLRVRSAATRVRASLLASSLGPDDQLHLRRQLEATQNLILRADGDHALVHRARRIEATLVDLLESFAAQVWIGEIAVASDAPLSDVFLRDVATAFTNELDVLSLSEYSAMAAPVVAGRRRLVGGYTIDRDPRGLDVALREGLPLAGTQRPRRLNDLMSPTEAALLLRWPVPAGRPIPTVSIAAARPRPTPAELPREGALIGTDSDGRPLRLARELRDRHLLLLGVSGSGKSTLIHRLALDDLRRGQQFVLVDPHGDIAARVRHAARSLDVPLIVVDPCDPATAAVALFDGCGGGPPDLELVERSVARIIEAVTSHLPGGWEGPRFRAIARAGLTLLAWHRGSHLAEVASLLYDQERCETLLRGFDGPGWVREQLRNHHQSRDKGEMAGWASAKFEDIGARALSRRVLAPVGSGRSLASMLSSGSSVVVNLAQGELGTLDVRLLGHIVLGATIDAVFERDVEARTPLALYCDEAHIFPATNLERGLNQGRKFGLSVAVAAQALAQLSPAAREAILGNAGVRCAFRLAPDDANRLALDLSVAPRELASQADLHAYVHVTGRHRLPVFSAHLQSPGRVPLDAGVDKSSVDDDKLEALPLDAPVADAETPVADPSTAALRDRLAKHLRELAARKQAEADAAQTLEAERRRVQPFDVDALRRSLDAGKITYRERDEYVLEADFPAEVPTGWITVQFKVEGTAKSVLKVRTVTPERFAPAAWPGLLIAVNRWNREMRWPTAILDVADPTQDADAGVVLDFDVALGRGVHAALLEELVELATSGGRCFWLELDRDVL